MPQTILTLAAELDPDRADTARALIEELRATIQGTSQSGAVGGGSLYRPLVASLPGLHFASIMIFEDERFDPLLTLELNFDGLTRDFLPSLQTSRLTPYLRAVLRCCKPPGDAALAKFKDATEQGPLAPYLETLIVKPAVFHQGNRGLDRQRILDEAALYDRVQEQLDAPAFIRPDDAVALHHALRGEMLPGHSWLGRPAPERITPLERGRDIARFYGLVLLVVAVLLVPGLLVGLASPTLGTIAGWAAVILIAFEAVRIGLHFLRNKPRALPRAAQLPPPPTHTEWVAQHIYLVIAGVLAVAVLTLCLVWPATRAADAGFVLIVGGAVHWLRRLETTDRVHQKPRTDPVRLREIMELEDEIRQNHMGSVVHVKPGILRAILVRLGLRGLGLLLRVRATDGYLANMRTIHFAHWALLDNGSRLLFVSNFDSSWESYLDDFIEKAHKGLTLAWSGGIGFPRTRFLVRDGATDGPLFKAWARHSMARGLFWVSAYPELSVNQIERNCAIATGLRAPSLTAWEAETWAALL